MFDVRPSTYFWWDARGWRRDIRQGEGCEQHDALAPALFALGPSDNTPLCCAPTKADFFSHFFASAHVRSECPILNDLYVLTTAGRARDGLNTTVHSRHSIAELGGDVWHSDNPPSERGIAVQGSPLGHPEFTSAWAEQRVHTERQLLDHLPWPTRAHDEAIWHTVQKCLGRVFRAGSNRGASNRRPDEKNYCDDNSCLQVVSD